MKRLGIAIALGIAGILLLLAIRAGSSPPDAAAEARGTGDRSGSASLDRALDSRPEVQDVPPVAGRESADPAARAPSATDGAANTFRGRVLDARTGEPVGRLVILVGDTAIEVDASGEFAAQPLSEGVRVLFVRDAFRKSHVATLEREKVEELGGQAVLRVEIGPTYFLRIVSPPPDGSERLIARLVERRADGREISGIWMSIPGPPEPFLRLDQAWRAHGEDSTFRIEVRNEHGVLSGTSGPLHQAVGVHPGLVEITLGRALGILRGRVVDPEGRPQLRARVLVLPLQGSMPSASPETYPNATTDMEGVFRLPPLESGTYEILAHPPANGRPARLRVVLEPGERDLGDLVVEPVASVGSIRGRLKISDRSLFQSTDRVRLRSVDARVADRFALPDFHSNRPRRRTNATPYNAPFSFDAVAAGDYELTVVSPAGGTWTPGRALVTAPAADVEFVCEESAGENLCIDVEDAATRAPVSPYSYSVRVGGSPMPIAEEGVDMPGEFCRWLPTNVAIEWSVWAEGYRTVRLERDDFTVSPEGLGAKVSLVRGFDASFRVLDFGDGIDPDDWAGRFASISHPGVAGAEIRADGVVLARTGADGRAEIGADREPAKIEIVAPGWRTAACWNMADGRIVAERQDVLVWMVRD